MPMPLLARELPEHYDLLGSGVTLASEVPSFPSGSHIVLESKIVLLTEDPRSAALNLNLPLRMPISWHSSEKFSIRSNICRDWYIALGPWTPPGMFIFLFMDFDTSP